MQSNILHIIHHPSFEDLLKFEDDAECMDLFKKDDFKKRLAAIRSSNKIGNLLSEEEIGLIWTAYELTFWDCADRLFSVGAYFNECKDESSWWKYRDHKKGDDLFEQEEDHITEVYSVYEHFGLYELRSSEWSGEDCRFGPCLTVIELVDVISELSDGVDRFPFKILSSKL